MEPQQIQLNFLSYASPADLPEEKAALLAAAKKALPNAYAPYSKFQVAAAAKTEDGVIMTACNTENAAYPMCICAERAALAAIASQFPQAKVVSMAITVKSPSQVLSSPASPCGACRQVLAEHEQRHGHHLELILQGEAGPVYVIERAQDLLPLGFGAEYL
ncbi:MAG: cytidine deaminase [Bacteroidota bacterium]